MVEETKEEVATPKALKKALEHEKTPELAAKLAAEAIERDAWAAEVSQLSLPKLVEQVALNAWKEQEGNRGLSAPASHASDTLIPPARSKSWPKR